MLKGGGFAKDEQILAGNKEFKPVLEKMCTLVTRDIFMLAIEDDPANAIYNAAEMDRLVSEENLAVVRED